MGGQDRGMRTLQAGAVVQALLAIANSDNTFWQGVFTGSSAIALLLAGREERKAA